MSIRMIAADLYRMMQRVAALEEALDGAPLDRREALREKLRQAKSERDQLRRILDGRKDG